MQGFKAAETGHVPYEMFAAVDEDSEQAEIKYVTHEAHRRLDQIRSESKRSFQGY